MTYSQRIKIAYATPARRQRICSLQQPDGKSFSTFFGIARVFITFLLAFLSTASVLGQEAFFSQIAFKHLTIDNVLPQNSVFAIEQDKHGFIWFATQDGLCRYDGYSVKLFRHDRAKPYSLRNNFTTSLLVDKSGTLWVGTAGGGLGKYNHLNYHFTAYIHEPNNPQSLSDNRIQTLYQDHAGMLWVGTERGGVNLFNPQTGTARAFLHNPTDEKSLPANRVYAITQDASKRLWIATLGGGLCYFDTTDSSFVRVLFGGVESKAAQGSLKPRKGASLPFAIENTNISALYADKEGFLWVGTRGAGVLRVEGRTNTWKRMLYDGSASRNVGSNDVASICEDSIGRLWIGFEGGGVSLYDKASAVTTNYRHEPLNPPSLSDNIVHGIFCDNVGTMWVGTATGGVNKYAANAHRFAVYQHEPMNPRSLASNVVRTFCEDKQGNIWVGAVDGGLNQFLRKEGAFLHHEYAPTNDTVLGREDVWALAAAADGTIWVGTQNGLFAYHPSKGTRKVYRHNPQNPRSLSSNTIRALRFDRDGMLWVGTTLGGICRFDAASETFIPYQFVFADSVSKMLDAGVSDHIRSILHGSDGTLWIGTVNLGVLAFDKERGTVKAAYQHNEAAPKGMGGLSNNTVRYLHEDKRGNIWVGTLDGLNCISPQNGTIRIVTEEDGLPNEVIYGILEDNSGYLWLTTNKGLVRFHPENRTFKTYTKQDGLQSNEFNGGAVLRGSDGWFYAGGISGFNTFHPDSIRDNGRIPPVMITDCKIFGQSLALDTAITERSTITLPYTHNNCTFEFVALNYVGAEKNQYRYILENFDTEWVDAGMRREAIYTNLEPGEYLFRVQGSNNDGIWNMEGAAMRLVITPPWWGTWYFRIGLALAIISVGYFTYQARVLALRQTARRLEEQVQTRTQVLTETNQRLAAANEEIQRQMHQQHEQAQELQKAYLQIDEANEILISRNYELLLLNKEKNDLLGIVSHDLRNPLVSTLLAIKLLQKRFPNLSDEEKFIYLEKIQGASEQMIDFITKLLDVNALETGKMPVSLVRCNVSIVAEAVIDNYQSRASAKSITLHYDAPPQLMVLADAVLLPQVLDNLVSNAVKYSPHGKNVFVRINSHSSLGIGREEDHLSLGIGHWSGDGNSANAPMTNDQFLRIEVQDEGPGLSEDDKEKLFAKFSRLSARPTGGEHSTGLGLSIVKKMVEAMSGHIWCESELGRGAIFIVELPMAAVTNLASAPSLKHVVE